MLHVNEHKCDCAYPPMKNYAACLLQLAAYFTAGHSTGRSTGRMVFYVCVRAIAFMFIHTQPASEFHCAISGNTENSVRPVNCSTRCGLWPAACGLRSGACGKVRTNINTVNYYFNFLVVVTFSDYL